MALRDRIKKLQREAGALYTTLSLPDGSEVRYTDEDALAALSACIDQREHWLLPCFRQAPTNKGLPGLIWALEASQERIERENEEMDSVP